MDCSGVRRRFGLHLPQQGGAVGAAEACVAAAGIVGDADVGRDELLARAPGHLFVPGVTVK